MSRIGDLAKKPLSDRGGEQAAADAGRVTEAQRRANADLERQIAERQRARAEAEARAAASGSEKKG